MRLGRVYGFLSRCRHTTIVLHFLVSTVTIDGYLLTGSEHLHEHHNDVTKAIFTRSRATQHFKNHLLWNCWESNPGEGVPLQVLIPSTTIQSLIRRYSFRAWGRDDCSGTFCIPPFCYKVGVDGKPTKACFVTVMLPLSLGLCSRGRIRTDVVSVMSRVHYLSATLGRGPCTFAGTILFYLTLRNTGIPVLAVSITSNPAGNSQRPSLPSLAKK